MPEEIVEGTLVPGKDGMGKGASQDQMHRMRLGVDRCPWRCCRRRHGLEVRMEEEVLELLHGSPQRGHLRWVAYEQLAAEANMKTHTDTDIRSHLRDVVTAVAVSCLPKTRNRPMCQGP